MDPLPLSADLLLVQGISAQYAKAWMSSALAPDGHVLANFGDPSTSWTNAYNLFAGRLLQTSIIDPAVGTSRFYESITY